MREIQYRQAIVEAISEEMQLDKNVFLIEELRRAISYDSYNHFASDYSGNTISMKDIAKSGDFYYLPPKYNYLPPILPPKNTGSKRIVWEPSVNTNAVSNTVNSV